MHLFTCIFIFISFNICTYYYVVVDPVDTTVCEGDTATFTCVYFISVGAIAAPGWIRDGDIAVNVMYVTSNLTRVTTTPAYVRSTVTLRKVTLLGNGTMYQCGLVTFLSNSSTLTVVGK